MPPGPLQLCRAGWEVALTIPWHSKSLIPAEISLCCLPALLFGVEFYQQQLSKINKEACACQCSRGRARDWQSGTINYSSAPLPACRLQEGPWQHAGEPEGQGRRGIMEGRGNVLLDAEGIAPEPVEAAGRSLCPLGVCVCTRVCRAGICVFGGIEGEFSPGMVLVCWWRG